MAKRQPAAAITREAIELVVRLCEQERPEVAWHVLEMHFRTAGQELIAAGALVETTPSKSIMMPVDNDDEPVEFEWEPELQVYAAFHPAMGWVTAGPNARRRYRLDLEWLLSILADQLGVPASARTTPLVPNLLWDLGDAWFGKRKATILFARRLGDETTFDSMCDALTRRVGLHPGVVLTTTSRLFSRNLTVPGRHSVLSVHDCLGRGGGPGLNLDPKILESVLLHGSIMASGPVEASADGGYVRVHDREFVFTGDIHRAIVRQLVKAWQSGRPKLRTQRVLEQAGSRARQLSRAFGGHQNWQDLIGYGRGFCWLKVD